MGKLVYDSLFENGISHLSWGKSSVSSVKRKASNVNLEEVHVRACFALPCSQARSQKVKELSAKEKAKIGAFLPLFTALQYTTYRKPHSRAQS
jgi:phosphoenolpyruvate-protein kinase (PTS system EI component)